MAVFTIDGPPMQALRAAQIDEVLRHARDLAVRGFGRDALQLARDAAEMAQSAQDKDRYDAAQALVTQLKAGVNLGAARAVHVAAADPFETWVAAVQHAQPVNYALARALVYQGAKILSQGVALNVLLPGQAKRDEVWGKLLWHGRKIASEIGPDPSSAQLAAPYPYAADLKKWVIQAMIEFRAEVEGLDWYRVRGNQFLTDLHVELANLPATMSESSTWFAKNFAKPIVDVATSIPWWVWLLLGVSVVGAGAAAYFYHRRQRRPALAGYRRALNKKES